jgi:hypothetical protein
MYQTITEEIAVAGTYKHQHFLPRKFEWHNRPYPIEEICSTHDFRDGSVRKRRYSVMAKGTLYLIEFNRDQEKWSLEQIWITE